MIRAVILAAGAGTRLGGPKALATVRGRTLVDIVVETCCASIVDEVIVVAGAEAEAVATHVAALQRRHPETPLRCVRHDRWAEGRTGSLQAGWTAAGPGPVLVFPVDHPAVRVVTLDALCGVFGYAGGELEVVVPVLLPEGHEAHGGKRRRGHPILLASRLRDEVLALGPDEPLHEVVHRHEVLEVPVDDPGILVDVDEPKDLERAEALLAPRP